jgi:beta-glucosidase-like glycosyl hydrolase
MTLEQKIAQLIMIRVYSNKDAKYDSTMEAEIAQFQPGGICFFQGTPIRQVELTNRLQSVSNIPMLVAIDGEWGPAMRLDSCLTFPYQMTLGALDEEDDPLIYQMGIEVAKQCKALGIHINFAPCVDVNNNSENPVINFRSFGEIRENVAKKSIHYMNGMQDNGISACAKHFPGHGDTKTDSHHALPVINKTYEALDSLEFYPFKKIIKEGVDFIMISHLNIPALDTAANSIASLSEEIVTGILRKKMQFNGIVITDAMDMKGLRNSYPNGSDAEIKALLSGVDILLLPNQLSEVIPAIKTAVENGIISESLIDEKCMKILKLKQAKGLNKFKKLSTNHLETHLMNEKTADIIQTD